MNCVDIIVGYRDAELGTISGIEIGWRGMPTMLRTYESPNRIPDRTGTTQWISDRPVLATAVSNISLV